MNSTKGLLNTCKSAELGGASSICTKRSDGRQHSMIHGVEAFQVGRQEGK